MTTLPTVSPQDSLLAKTNPNTINELFNRDPLGFSNQDLDSIVRFFREKREDWVQEEKQGKAAKPKAEKKPAVGKATLADLKGLVL